MWQNWSGSVKASPCQQLVVKNEADLQELVNAANKDNHSIRVVGSGHSFVPLCQTNDVLLNLDVLQGVLSVDTKASQATIAAGSKLSSLGEPLLNTGFAMQNLGDIDKQSLAGAISTGTHGTGQKLGSISTQVTGLRFINGLGEYIDCSETLEPELFKAAQVSLGALGIITQVTLKLLPAYRLHEKSWTLPFEACMGELEELITSNRHFEFFWLPAEDICAAKILNPTKLEYLPRETASPDVSEAAARYVQSERIDWSHRIFPSVRERKFNEQEFAVPAPLGQECLREIRELMQAKYQDVLWPIEYRTVAADDIPLSPFFKRDSVTLSVHQAADLPYKTFFKDTEAIFKNYKGRPHWGKIHSLETNDLKALYPAWESFHLARKQSDPEGRFLNGYLQNLFAS